jgi:Fur family ferric uptake transcriptional regulator
MSMQLSVQQAETQIRALGHRVTSARLMTLAYLLQAEKPVTHDELLTHIALPMDRVTLYRVLDWLVRQKLAHKVTTEDRLWRFIAGDGGRVHHPHFYCENTGKLICLTDVKLPDITLPKQFKVSHVEIVFHGVCEA